MVLIIIFLSLFTPSESLLDKYSKAADQEVENNLSALDYDYAPVDFAAGELYKIKQADQLIGYLLLSEVAACNLGGCPSYKSVERNGSSEYFDLMAIISPEHKIISIKILDYFSDYGYEITSRNYLKKFKNTTICSFHEGQDQIDAISGATISSLALEAKLGQLCPHL